jgi:predicted DCC family thiol-disulfide oxidoreductase YuxK
LNRDLGRLVVGSTPARPVALTRIGVGFAVLLELANTGPALLRLTEPGIIAVPYLQWVPRIGLALAWVIIAVWLLSVLAFTLGWRARIAGAALTVTLAVVLLMDQQLYSNHLYLMAVVCGLLTIADSSAAISLDAIRAGERLAIPAWPVWLLRTQVSMVYAFTALAKLNPDFLSGSVVASYLRRTGPLAVPESWRTFEPMFVLSLLAIAAEAFLVVALWRGRWRPAGYVIGLGLHAFITLWLDPPFQLLAFSLLMLSLYLLFLPSAPRAQTVVWDDGCGFCAAWVRWFRRLDWLHTLVFVPRSELSGSGLPVDEAAAARAIQLVSSGRVHAGFAAVTRVAEALPISFLWAPLLRLPLVTGAGEAAYRRVALRRSCDITNARNYSADVRRT